MDRSVTRRQGAIGPEKKNTTKRESMREREERRVKKKERRERRSDSESQASHSVSESERESELKPDAGNSRQTQTDKGKEGFRVGAGQGSPRGAGQWARATQRAAWLGRPHGRGPAHNAIGALAAACRR